MLVASTEQRLHKALSAVIGRDIKLRIMAETVDAATPAKLQAQATANRQQEAEVTMANDPMVRAMEEQMGARLIPGSVRPVND
jgi:DNA polymerase-3 subunit gamma/tau